MSAWLGLGCAAAPATRGSFSSMRVQFALQPLGGHTDLFKHGGDDALAVFKQRQQQMDGLHLGVAELGGARLRLLHRLLRLDGEFVPTNGHERQLLASSSQLLACSCRKPESSRSFR